MLHGIEMNVVHVPDEVVVITNSVFPVARLPKGKFAVGMAPDFDTCNEQVGAEMSLDPTPASGEIRVSVRERQYRMQMIGRNHDRVEVEGPFPPGRAKRRTKRAYLIDQNCRSAIHQR